MAVSIRWNHENTWDAVYNSDNQLIRKEFFIAENSKDHAIVKEYENKKLVKSRLKALGSDDEIISYDSIYSYNIEYNDNGNISRKYLVGSETTESTASVINSDAIQYSVIYDGDNQPFYISTATSQVLPIGDSKFYTDSTKTEVAFTTEQLEYNSSNYIYQSSSNTTGYVYDKNGNVIIRFGIINSDIMKFIPHDSTITNKYGIVLYKDNKPSTIITYNLIYSLTFTDDTYEVQRFAYSINTSKSTITEEGYESYSVSKSTNNISTFKIVNDKIYQLTDYGYTTSGINYNNSYEYEYNEDYSEYVKYKLNSDSTKTQYQGIVLENDDKGRIIKSTEYNYGNISYSGYTYNITYTDNEDGSYIKKVELLSAADIVSYTLSNSTLRKTRNPEIYRNLSNDYIEGVLPDTSEDIFNITENNTRTHEAKFDSNGNILYVHALSAADTTNLQYSVDVEYNGDNKVTQIKYYTSSGSIDSNYSYNASYNEDGSLHQVLFISDNGTEYRQSFECIYNYNGITGFNGRKYYNTSETDLLFGKSKIEYKDDTIKKVYYYNKDGSICWTNSYEKDTNDSRTTYFNPSGESYKIGYNDNTITINDTTVDRIKTDTSYKMTDASSQSLAEKTGCEYHYAHTHNVDGRKVLTVYTSSNYYSRIFTKKLGNFIIDTVCAGDMTNLAVNFIVISCYDDNNTKYREFIIYPSNYTNYSYFSPMIKYDSNNNLLNFVKYTATQSTSNNKEYTSYNHVGYIQDTIETSSDYQSWECEYDSTNRLITHKNYSGDVNNQYLVSSSSNKSRHITYNDNDKIESIEYYATGSSTSWTKIYYTYNENGDILSSREYIVTADGETLNWTGSNTRVYEYTEDNKLKTIYSFASETERNVYKSYTYDDEGKRKCETDNGYILEYTDPETQNLIKETYSSYTDSDSQIQYYKTYEEIYTSDNVKLKHIGYYRNSSTGAIIKSEENEYYSSGTQRSSIRYRTSTGKKEYEYTNAANGNTTLRIDYFEDGETIKTYDERFEDGSNTKDYWTKNSNGIITYKRHREKPLYSESYWNYDDNGNLTSGTEYTYNSTTDLLEEYHYTYNPTSNGYEYKQKYDPKYGSTSITYFYRQYKDGEVDWVNYNTYDDEVMFVDTSSTMMSSYMTKRTAYTEDGTAYTHVVKEYQSQSDSPYPLEKSCTVYDKDGNILTTSSTWSSYHTSRSKMIDSSYVTEYYTTLASGELGWQYSYTNITNVNGIIQRRNTTYYSDNTSIINWTNSDTYDYKTNADNRIIYRRSYSSEDVINWSYNSYDCVYDKFGNTTSYRCYNSDGSINWTNSYDIEYVDKSVSIKETRYLSSGDISRTTVYDRTSSSNKDTKYSYTIRSNGKIDPNSISINLSDEIDYTQRKNIDLSYMRFNTENSSVNLYNNQNSSFYSIDSSFVDYMKNAIFKVGIFTISNMNLESHNGYYTISVTDVLLSYIDTDGSKVTIRNKYDYYNSKFTSLVISRETSDEIQSRYYSTKLNTNSSTGEITSTINWTQPDTYHAIINDDGSILKYRFRAENDEYLMEGFMRTKNGTTIEQRYYLNGTIQWNNTNTCDIICSPSGKELYRVYFTK